MVGGLLASTGVTKEGGGGAVARARGEFKDINAEGKARVPAPHARLSGPLDALRHTRRNTCLSARIRLLAQHPEAPPPPPTPTLEGEGSGAWPGALRDPRCGLLCEAVVPEHMGPTPALQRYLRPLGPGVVPRPEA